jgi:hypothetical protein
MVERAVACNMVDGFSQHGLPIPGDVPAEGRVRPNTGASTLNKMRLQAAAARTHATSVDDEDDTDDLNSSNTSPSRRQKRGSETEHIKSAHHPC